MSAVAGSEAAVRRRILRCGLLLAVAGQILWSFRPAPGRALTAQEAEGRMLYEASCSTCHGLQAEGSIRNPANLAYRGRDDPAIPCAQLLQNRDRPRVPAP